MIFCTNYFRIFLCLFAGGQSQPLPQALRTEGAGHTSGQAAFETKRSLFMEFFIISSL